MTPEEREGLIAIMKAVDISIKREKRMKHITGVLIGTGALILLIIFYDFWLVALISLLIYAAHLIK